MKQAHVFISGFVQGVGYRQFVKRKAQEFGLSGWVKNLPDGRVEAVFQESKENIEKAIDACRKGPFISEVENVHIIWEESPKVYQDFEVRI